MCAASPRRTRKDRLRPQGLAPLPSPWRHPVLPPDVVRSSLGLAYQIEPDPRANRRPKRPPESTRGWSPQPVHRSGEVTPTRSSGHGTDRPARRCRSTSPAGPNPTSHRARQRGVDGADSAWSPDAMDEAHHEGEHCRGSRWVVLRLCGCAPQHGTDRAEATTSLAWVHCRTLGRARPRPGCSSLHAPPKRGGDRSRPKGCPSTNAGKPALESEPTGSARRPGSRAFPTKSTPFQGLRDPACRRPVQEHVER